MIPELTYYDSKVGTVRTSRMDDCYQVAKYMRKADQEECWAAARLSPIEAMLSSYQKSAICITGERSGFPILMCGLVPYNLCGDTASIWMLGTDGITGLGPTFVRRSFEFIKSMLNIYPYLDNYVDVRNKVSINWLKWCGAKFGKTEPYGIDKMPFTYFYFEKRK